MQTGIAGVVGGICAAAMGKTEEDQGATRTMTSAESGSHSFKTRGIYFHDGFDAEPKRHAPLYWNEDQWRREEGAWRFTHRKLIVEWEETRPVTVRDAGQN